MAMRRDSGVQPDLMVSWAELPRSPGHVFYDRLQTVLVEAGFDAFVEDACKPYYAPKVGAPSLPPAAIVPHVWPRSLSPGVLSARPMATFSA